MSRASERVAYLQRRDRPGARGAGARSGIAASSTATRCSTRRGPSGTASSGCRSTSSASIARSATSASIPGIGLAELKRITEEVLQRNLPLLEPDDDYWVTQRVTRGLDASAPRDLRAVRADRDRRVPAAAAPRARHALPRRHPGRRAVGPARGARQPERPHQDEQLPQRGHGRPRGRRRAIPRPGRSSSTSTATSPRASGATSSWSRRHLYTPREQFVLPGISRETAIELARELGYTVAREGHRPLRRLQRRRGLPDLDQPLRLPGAELQRAWRSAAAGCRGRSPSASSRRTAAWSTTTSSPST